MAVGWDLQPNEWFLVEALIKRCGVAALVVSAKGSWQGARTQPRSGRYFLPAWRTLSDAPIEVPDQSGSSLPAAVGQVVPLTGTDARVAGWAALTQRLRDRDAQENP